MKDYLKKMFNQFNLDIKYKKWPILSYIQNCFQREYKYQRVDSYLF